MAIDEATHKGQDAQRQDEVYKRKRGKMKKIICKLFSHQFKDICWHISNIDSLIQLRVDQCYRCKGLRLKIYDAYTGMVYVNSIESLEIINKQLADWNKKQLNERDLI
jgi:hypothetical protein